MYNACIIYISKFIMYNYVLWNVYITFKYKKHAQKYMYYFVSMFKYNWKLSLN